MTVTAPAADGRSRTDEAGGPVLSVHDLHVHFGGVRALDGVDLDVREGTILGLIGPNGAGKTTLFECIAGFTDPDGGSVVFDGVDVTALRPEARGRRGLIRSFQDARLFASLTVHQTVMASLERATPSRLFDSLFSLPVERRRERRKAERADELIASMGLGAYRDKFIRELSTGTRRIAELACVLALEPRLLLLDEPSSGIAQRESEALGPVLLRVRELTGCTIVMIEHDMPLIMGLAHEIVAMESGRVIARGSPEEVRDDPAVVAAYLGTDAVAAARSGHAPGRERAERPEASPVPSGIFDGRCVATTRQGHRCRNPAKPGTTACGIAAHRRMAAAPPDERTNDMEER